MEGTLEDMRLVLPSRSAFRSFALIYYEVVSIGPAAMKAKQKRVVKTVVTF